MWASIVKFKVCYDVVEIDVMMVQAVFCYLGGTHGGESELARMPNSVHAVLDSAIARFKWERQSTPHRRVADLK